MMIRVGLADNQLYFKKGIVATFSDETDIEICWDVCSVQDLDEVMAHSPADVLLVSLDLKGLEIFSFIDRQKLQSPTVKIVVITVSPDLFQAKELLTAGVNAILTRDTDEDDIVMAIRSVFETDVYFNELVSRALLTRLRSKSLSAAVDVPRFSKNEIRVLELLADGCKTQEIASRIFLSVKSVENIRYQLKVKTGASTSTALVVYALRNRLIR